MTDTEIIKALECCQRKAGCLDCHFLDDREPIGECIAKLSRATVDLINRQKAEIEGWKEAFNNLDKIARPSVEYVKSEKSKLWTNLQDG